MISIQALHMAAELHVAAGLLADSGESKKSGPIGLLVILLMCVGCYFLFKSMSKHLRKVREEFPASAPSNDSPPPTDGVPVSGSPAGAVPSVTPSAPVGESDPGEPADS